MHNLISIRNQAGEISDLKQGVRKCYTGIKFLFKKGYRCGYSRGGCSRSTYLHLTERINSISCGSRFLLLYLCIGFVAPMLYHWAKETLRWARSITKSTWHASCMLPGSATLIASRFIIRIREMVSSELGKEIEKDVFVSSRAWEEEKNSDSPWGNMGTQNCFFVPRSW